MSLLWPRTKAETRVAGWMVASWLIIPQLAFIALFWKLHFTAEAHLWNLATSLALALPLAALTVRRAAYMAQAGLHPYFRDGHRFSMKQRLVLWLGSAYMLYFIGLVLLSAHLFVVGDRSTRVAVVEQAGECTRRCLGCGYTANVRDAVMDAKVCVDTVNPRPVAGSRVTIYGLFSNYATFISSVAA